MTTSTTTSTPSTRVTGELTNDLRQSSVATPIGTMTVVGSAAGVRAILWDGEQAPDGVPPNEGEAVLADAVPVRPCSSASVMYPRSRAVLGPAVEVISLSFRSPKPTCPTELTETTRAPPVDEAASLAELTHIDTALDSLLEAHEEAAALVPKKLGRLSPS